MNNGAASPFAQARAFGTNRPNQRSLYTYVGGLQTWQLGVGCASRIRSAAPTRPAPVVHRCPVHRHLSGAGRRFPASAIGSTSSCGYQGTSDHNANTQSSIVPTELERPAISRKSVNAGASRFRSTIRGPASRSPATGSRRADQPAGGGAARRTTRCPTPMAGFNYQTPIVTASRSDSASTRLGLLDQQPQSAAGHDRLQRTSGDIATLFGFEDTSEGLGHRRAGELVAPDLAVHEPATPLSVHAAEEHVAAVLRRTAPTYRRKPASSATTRIRSTGVRRRCCSPAISPG